MRSSPASRPGGGCGKCCAASSCAACPASVPAVERLELADQRPRHLRTVAVEHAGVVGVEQRVLDARETGSPPALDYDGVLRVDAAADPPDVARAGRVGFTPPVYPVV